MTLNNSRVKLTVAALNCYCGQKKTLLHKLRNKILMTTVQKYKICIFFKESFLRVFDIIRFRPLSDFICESKRILRTSGLLVIAIPLTTGNSSFGKLGVLKFTWSSEHYSLDYLKKN